MRSLLREAVFYALVFLYFYLALEWFKYLSSKSSAGDWTRILTVCAVFTLLVAATFRFSGIKNGGEGFQPRGEPLGIPGGPGPDGLNISPGAMCQGGPYMYQGDGWFSKMCRAMEKTEEGRRELAAHNCAVGFHGQPQVPFRYSSNSDSEWKGIPCDSDRSHDG